MAITITRGAEFGKIEAGSLSGHQWIVGSTPVVEILRVDDGLHRSELVGVKYSKHRPTDPLKGDTCPDPYTRVTMLVEGGPWEQRMWDPTSELDVTYRLSEPGDFIAWQPGPHHSWMPIGNSTMLTVTYKKVPSAEMSKEGD